MLTDSPIKEAEDTRKSETAMQAQEMQVEMSMSDPDLGFIADEEMFIPSVKSPKRKKKLQFKSITDKLFDLAVALGGEVESKFHQLDAAQRKGSSDKVKRLVDFGRTVIRQTKHMIHKSESNSCSEAVQVLQQLAISLSLVRFPKETLSEYDRAELHFDTLSSLAYGLKRLGNSTNSLVCLIRSVPHAKKMQQRNLRSFSNIDQLVSLLLQISEAQLKAEKLDQAYRYAVMGVGEAKLNIERFERKLGPPICLMNKDYV